MKLVFLFLLLANGLLYMWQTYIVSPTNPVVAGSLANVPELVMLEETGTTVQAIAAASRQPEDNAVTTTSPEAGQNAVAFLGSAEPFPSAAEACFSVGPFIDDDSLEQAQQLFARNQVDYQQRTFTKNELFGYNVMIPPLATREEAVSMVGTLVAKGVTDYYVMTEGEFKNAISLGLFKEHRFAVQHLNGLQEKGISAEMKTRYFERSRHWLDYVDGENKIEQSVLRKLSPESDVQRLPRACS